MDRAACSVQRIRATVLHVSACGQRSETARDVACTAALPAPFLCGYLRVPFEVGRDGLPTIEKQVLIHVRARDCVAVGVRDNHLILQLCGLHIDAHTFDSSRITYAHDLQSLI